MWFRGTGPYQSKAMSAWLFRMAGTISPSQQKPAKQQFEEDRFVAYMAEGHEVLEIVLDVAPRDVHLDRREGQQGRWKVNEKVSFRKLDAEDQLELLQAMRTEVGSYLEREAVEIALKPDIPKERVMPMCWVLTWEAVEDSQGQVQGKKAKARLIIKGFLDPDLLHVKRESYFVYPKQEFVVFCFCLEALECSGG